MKEFKTLKELFNNLELIPEIVGLDVMVRIQDWMMSGGKEEDAYIQRQLKFASQFISHKGE